MARTQTGGQGATDRQMKKIGLIVLLLALAFGAVLAQRRGRGRWYSGDGYRTAREMPQHSETPTPVWTNTAGFERDVFTFVRIKRESGGYSGGPWDTDASDSDLNISYRLQQVTSVKVDPDGLFLRLTDKELSDYPFIYMVE